MSTARPKVGPNIGERNAEGRSDWDAKLPLHPIDQGTSGWQQGVRGIRIGRTIFKHGDITKRGERSN
jgi:hypothetical protein